MTIITTVSHFIYDGIAGKREYYKGDRLVTHSYKRINEALIKCQALPKDKQLNAFDNAMLGRLKKIKNMDKIIIAMIILSERGYQELAEKYESAIVLNLISR